MAFLFCILIFGAEQGAVDNPALRQLTGGEVLLVSQELRRLRELHLLESKGKGSATYYIPGPEFPPTTAPFHQPGHGTLASDHGTLTSDHGTLASDHGTLAGSLPDELRLKLASLGQRPGERIRPMILELCAWRALTAAELAEIFGRSDSRGLKRDHLGPLIAAKQLEYTYPDMERHPKQAYRIAQRHDRAQQNPDECEGL